MVKEQFFNDNYVYRMYKNINDMNCNFKINFIFKKNEKLFYIKIKVK